MDTFSLFTWSKQKWLFWRPDFNPANQSNLKVFKNLWLAGKKPALQKSHFCFDHVNRLIVTCRHSKKDSRKWASNWELFLSSALYHYTNSVRWSPGVVFSRNRQDGSVPNFFQDLGENTCSLQPALKNTALGFWIFEIKRIIYKNNLLMRRNFNILCCPSQSGHKGLKCN